MTYSDPVFEPPSQKRLEYATRAKWMGAQVQWLKLPAWKVGVRGFEPHSGLQVSKKQNVLPRSLVTFQYCGGPPRGSVLGLRPPGLEFRILCMEGSVISFFSPSLSHHPHPPWIHNFFGVRFILQLNGVTQDIENITI